MAATIAFCDLSRVVSDYIHAYTHTAVARANRKMHVASVTGHGSKLHTELCLWAAEKDVEQAPTNHRPPASPSGVGLWYQSEFLHL